MSTEPLGSRLPSRSNFVFLKSVSGTRPDTYPCWFLLPRVFAKRLQHRFGTSPPPPNRHGVSHWGATGACQGGAGGWPDPPRVGLGVAPGQAVQQIYPPSRSLTPHQTHPPHLVAPISPPTGAPASPPLGPLCPLPHLPPFLCPGRLLAPLPAQGGGFLSG